MDPIWPNPKYFTNPGFPEIRDFPSKRYLWGAQVVWGRYDLTRCYGIQNGNNLGSIFFIFHPFNVLGVSVHLPCSPPKYLATVDYFFTIGRAQFACTQVYMRMFIHISVSVCVHWRHSLSLSPSNIFAPQINKQIVVQTLAQRNTRQKPTQASCFDLISSHLPRTMLTSTKRQ